MADPTPVQGPTHQYSEKAKEITAKLVQEMEEKDVTEPFPATWLSPIVLASKPNGSKQLCLDYWGVKNI